MGGLMILSVDADAVIVGIVMGDFVVAVGIVDGIIFAFEGIEPVIVVAVMGS